MRQTFSSISAAARQVAVNRQTGAWTAAARRQKARQVAVNRQTGIWTADTGRHTPHQIGDLYVCQQDHGAGNRENVLSGYSVPAPVEGT